jgi:hypothetical protein
MPESFGFVKGVVRECDAEAVRKETEEPEGCRRMVSILEKEEPFFLAEAHRVAQEEIEAVEDLFSPIESPLIYRAVLSAMVKGFLLHKKANDRLWSGIDINSKI